MAEYTDYASAVHQAYFGSDDEFDDAISAYESAVSMKIEELSFKREAELGGC
ncbi:MAG: hypothetical protein VXZ36_12930 [Pseudomonadota bacterium]|nr:hypothetical protein [Pseudomonadota bacterium]MEC8418714.1 hypothetical protein [Pseudomonadota bacterium]